MTLAALLSHFGIGDRRYVTTDGLILFDGVSGSSGFGYSHPVHGSVTPVQKHTFHGDTDEPIDVPSSGFWWQDSEELARQDTAMRAAFPRFTRRSDTSRPPVWTGSIDTGRGVFAIEVRMREDRGLPFIRVLGGPRLGIANAGRWVRSPHLYDNGNLCVADQADWNPDEHTAETAVVWAAHWLAAYTEWRIIKRWPVAGAHPDAA